MFGRFPVKSAVVVYKKNVIVQIVEPHFTCIYWEMY